MRFDVLTLFPEIFSGYLGQSVLRRAIERGLVDVRLHNIRQWADNKHNSVDDRPFGGGPGMGLMVKPVVECVEAVPILEPDEISIGDFILNGGEVAAMAVIDSVIRLVPDVLGDEDSSGEDSFSGPGRLLEFAQYTRPRVYRGLEVPPILLSGNHEEIARWRKQNSQDRTRNRRADLLQ
ncbi:MAG: tRNA (guanosine(37)-N1)-methyltransferase TrmD [Planctomycetia bacterium]|nr:tRNA (guanosine(37)-N1)-methyltransferase TrmD [Planctomycetia bacterium]